jgi:Flp pilus assembly protein TadG
MKALQIRTRGLVLIYLMVAFSALIGLALLAVDFGRISSVKTALGAAADGAARNAVRYITNGDLTALRNAAKETAAANIVDGSGVTLADSDIEVGTWNSGSQTFTPTSINDANAVRVTARRSSIPLLFGKFFSHNSTSVAVPTVVMLDGGTAATTLRVEGTMNLWLAGMPNGNYGGSTNTGTAPANSPRQVTGITLVPGSALTFNVVGSTADDPVNINQNWTPDGQPGGNRTNDTGYLHGMAQLNTQQASLIGVFLTDAAPNSSAAPASLYFSTDATRDYTSISPGLKQPFFIGDGRRSNGTQQQVIVPAGATRLFLGTHDNVNWANNSGHYMVSINGSKPKVVRVK